MRDLRPSPGRESARERRLARVGLSCLVSLAAHVAFFAGLLAAGALGLLDRPVPLAIALKPLSAADWAANRGLASAPAPPPEEPREVVALPPDVDRDPAREEREPTGRVRYLAARDQTVEKETVSRHAGAFAKLLRVPQRKVRGHQGSGEGGRQKIAVPGRTGPPGGGGTQPRAVPPSPPPDERATAPPEPAPAPPSAALGDSPLPGDGEGGRRIDGRRVAGMPLQEYPRPAGGPDLNGLGLPEGAETRLHTRRFEPAAYWTDLRARVQADWQQRVLGLLEKFDPHEEVFFYKPRTVRIVVTLDARGGLVDAHVLESSRLDFYDDVALAAVKDKQPYPPPPLSAIRPDGSARINWAFTWLPSDFSHALR